MSEQSVPQNTPAVHLVPFLFETDTMVRVTDRDGNPWFMVADIGRVTGIGNPTQAVKSLPESEKVTLTLNNNEGVSDKMERVFVSENGLYSLIFRSHAAMDPKTKAFRFTRWVTGEVLPALRKTGHYEMPGRQKESMDPAMMSLEMKLKIVELYRRIGGALAGAEMIAKLGLWDVLAIRNLANQGRFGFMVDLDDTAPGPTDGVN
jgi:prophage antirepressor-like protein